MLKLYCKSEEEFQKLNKKIKDKKFHVLAQNYDRRCKQCVLTVIDKETDKKMLINIDLKFYEVLNSWDFKI